MKPANVMKNHTLRRCQQAPAWVLALGFLVWTAVGQPRAANAELLTSPFQPFLVQIADANGNVPSDPSTPLFRKGSSPLVPINKPNGQQVTLAEWTSPSGSTTIERVANGTSVSFVLTGLIPNGVYSAWGEFDKAPGLLPPTFPNRIGFGALGLPDGSQSAFTADANGAATLGPTIQPPGPLSVTGVVPPFVLDGDVFQYGLFVAYHLDGAPKGTSPGTASEFAVQTHAAFTVPEPSSIGLILSAVAGLAAFRRRKRSE